MPIFHEQDDSPPQDDSQHVLFVEPRRDAYAGASEGTLLDSLFSKSATEPAPAFDRGPFVPDCGLMMPVLNRVELIERIKRGKSPVWPPSQIVSRTDYPTLVPTRLFMCSLKFLVISCRR